MKESTRKRIAWMVVFGLLAALLSGCGGTKRIKSPTELVLAGIGEEPDGFDPVAGWDAFHASFLHSTLLCYDREGNLTTDAAQAWRVSGDGRTYSVELRRDVTLSNGDGLTAHDVKFTFDTAKKNAGADLALLDSVEVTSAYSVDFHLSSPSALFPDLLAAVGLVPMNLYDEDYGENPVGSGPYRILQWDKGRQLVLVPNEYYYGEKPHYTRLTILFLSESAAFAAAKEGTVDIASASALEARGQTVGGMEQTAVQSGAAYGISFPMGQMGAAEADGSPVGNDVTCDPAIRKALNVGLSRQALVEEALSGAGYSVYNLCQSSPFMQEDTQFADNQPALAGQMLEEAGWRDENGDGIREKDGVSATFGLYYPAGDSTRRMLAEGVADFAKTIGIAVELHPASQSEISRVMHAEAVLFAYSCSTPWDLYRLFHSTLAGKDGCNPNGYENPTVDGYLTQAMKAADRQEAYAFLQNAQYDGATGFAYQGDAPWLWLCTADSLYYVRDGVDIGSQADSVSRDGWPLLRNVAEWKAAPDR